MVNGVAMKKCVEKKRKGFSLPEILVACAIMVALSAAAFFGFNQAQQTRKMAQMHSDMQAIAAGCLAFESMNTLGLPPGDLATLMTGLDADNSIDGAEHRRFVTSTKSEDTIADPWGNDYIVNGDERTITCTHQDSGGNDMTTVIVRF